MVKVNAPMMSLEASGSLAGAIVFSSWKGRPYVRELVRPSNPKSVLQVAVRAMMKFLAQSWKTMTAPEKATWAALAKGASVSEFNAEVGFNMKNWRQHLAPAASSTALRTGTMSTITSFVATGGFHQAVLVLTVGTLADGWGAIIHQTLTDVAPTDLTTVIGVIKAESAAAFSFTNTNLTAGTYYYWYHLFTRAGKLDTTPIHATTAAVVT
jgi:hypothetical protein